MSTLERAIFFMASWPSSSFKTTCFTGCPVMVSPSVAASSAFLSLHCNVFSSTTRDVLWHNGCLLSTVAWLSGFSRVTGITFADSAWEYIKKSQQEPSTLQKVYIQWIVRLAYDLFAIARFLVLLDRHVIWNSCFWLDKQHRREIPPVNLTRSKG